MSGHLYLIIGVTKPHGILENSCSKKLLMLHLLITTHQVTFNIGTTRSYAIMLQKSRVIHLLTITALLHTNYPTDEPPLCPNVLVFTIRFNLPLCFRSVLGSVYCSCSNDVMCIIQLSVHF